MKKYKVSALVNDTSFAEIDMWFDENTTIEEIEQIMWDWATSYIDIKYVKDEGAKLN